jgi:hypothetical protein
MSTRRVLSVTGDAALQLLRLTHASADVLPPVKKVAGEVLYMAHLAAVRPSASQLRGVLTSL